MSAGGDYGERTDGTEYRYVRRDDGEMGPDTRTPVLKDQVKVSNKFFSKDIFTYYRS